MSRSPPVFRTRQFSHGNAARQSSFADLRSVSRVIARPAAVKSSQIRRPVNGFSPAAHCWISGTRKAKIPHLRYDFDLSIE
jgi:hypothetical protein